MDLIFALGGWYVPVPDFLHLLRVLTRYCYGEKSVLFSGYIVYDTYNINAKLSPDEFIFGAISLYLEYVVVSCHSIPFSNLLLSLQFPQPL